MNREQTASTNAVAPEPGIRPPLDGKFTLSISTLLPLVLGALIIAAVLPVALVGYVGTQDVSRRLLRDRGELLMEAVASPIGNLLVPVAEAMDNAVSTLTTGTVAPDGGEQFEAFMRGLLAATNHVSGISLVAPDGTLRRWSRDSEDRLDGDQGLTFRRQLFAEAADGGGATWSAPFFSYVNGETIITYRAPIRRDGELLGLLTAAVSLNSISASLKTIGEEFAVVPFLLANRNEIVAHPATALSRPGTSPPTIASLGDPIMAAIWNDQRPLTETDPLRHARGHWSTVNGVSYTYLYRDLQLGNGSNLLVGYYLTSATTRRDRLMRYYVAGIGGVLLVAAVLTAAYVGRRLARPLQAFGQASTAIGDFRFGAVRLGELQASRVREIAGTASALTRMARGIELFQRYVPRALVRQLITLGDESSRPVKRDITVLFLDLEGYTRFSSGRNASDVADYLNATFGRVGPIIEASGGTIDKYTGDGLMAFWGAPADDPSHARHALECAFGIADCLRPYLEAASNSSQETCRVRMGIHTGGVMVGDVGYEGRIDYTVVGEVVNLTKRVESGLRGLAPEHLVVVAATEATLRSSGIDLQFVKLEPLQVGHAWRIDRRR